MILCLVGKAGAGKTTIANELEAIIPDCFIIDGDDMREETQNFDISINGREKNMRRLLNRARWVSNLGFTVIVSAQLPLKEIRDEYLEKNDILVEINNSGPNPKDEKGYNKHFVADYRDANYKIEFVNRDIFKIYDKIFPKILVIARFQGMHKGHKIVMESAKRLSPCITLALRVDDGDKIDLEENIKLAQKIFPYVNIIKSPDIIDSNKIWGDFVSDFDVVVQGNPIVIEKFQDAINDEKIRLEFIPRIGKVSATKIREAIQRGDEDFVKLNIADPKVLDLLKKEINN